MKYFGEPYPSAETPAPIYETSERVDTPVGERCQYCERAIEEGERGFMIPFYSALAVKESPWHQRCLLESIIPNDVLEELGT